MVAQDPNRPKRPSSSFMFFANEMRPTVRAENPGMPITDVARQLGTLWRAQDETKRKPFEELAEKDRARYKEQMVDYVPPENDDAKYKRSSKSKAKAKARTYVKKSKSGKGKHKSLAKIKADKAKAKARAKASKDPNKPKRAMSSFMYFANDKRPEVRRLNPDMKIPDIGKLLGTTWNNMSDKNKARYIAMAEVDKARYVKQMETYVPPTKPVFSSSSDESSSSSSSDSSSDLSSDSSSD